MQSRLPQLRVTFTRAGFTLIELLVAMVIFAILATIAIGAYRGLSDSDRLRNGTQLFQGANNSARSKAIHDKLPRGVRLIASTDDPSLVDSLIHIGALPNFDGATLAATDNPDGSGFYSGRRLVIPSASPEFAEFVSLFNSQSLTNEAIRANGLRIQLGSNNKRWYRIQSVDPADVDGFAIFLAEPFPYINRTADTLLIPYSLELGPTPLPGAQPIALPKDTVIDLDASVLPSAWRPSLATTPNYSTRMDIMFTPGGTLQGAIVANGMLHFYFADRRDASESPAVPETGPYPFFGTIADSYESRLVTLVTASAQTYAADVDTTSGGMGRYRFAVKGKEAKQ